MPKALSPQRVHNTAQPCPSGTQAKASQDTANKHELGTRDELRAGCGYRDLGAVEKETVGRDEGMRWKKGKGRRNGEGMSIQPSREPTTGPLNPFLPVPALGPVQGTR